MMIGIAQGTVVVRLNLEGSLGVTRGGIVVGATQKMRIDTEVARRTDPAIDVTPGEGMMMIVTMTDTPEGGPEVQGESLSDVLSMRSDEIYPMLRIVIITEVEVETETIGMTGEVETSTEKAEALPNAEF